MADWTGNQKISGALYEGYMGRWSRRMAVEFLRWLDAPAHLLWLDVGCGTGALTHALLNQYAPRSIVGVDPLLKFVEYARHRQPDARTHYCVGSGGALPLGDRVFDQVVSGLALNFMPDADAALREMKRVAVADGRVALYIWDYAEGMQMVRIFFDAALAVDNEHAASEDEGKRFPLSRQDGLRAAFARNGYTNITVEPIEITAHFANFDDYWEPFRRGDPFPAPRYYATLPEEKREALRARVLQRLPLRADGSFDLTLRAWAAQGA